MRRTLPTVTASGDGNTASISSVTSVEGDCDIGQRKGKLLTIYDLEVSAKWAGTNAAGDEFTGTLAIPEFSHETIDGLSDYVFDISVDQASAGADAFRTWLRGALPPALEPVLNGFRGELLSAHGIFETPAGSGASTPAVFKQGYSPAPPGEQHVSAVAAAAAKDKGGKKEERLRTVTVEASAQLHASASDLWALLTDASRVPLWSRASADIAPEVGRKYALFNGNVSGAIISVDAPHKLVQSWQTKSPGWPSGEARTGVADADHHGIMTITLAQGSDSTQGASARVSADGSDVFARRRARRQGGGHCARPRRLLHPGVRVRCAPG